MGDQSVIAPSLNPFNAKRTLPPATPPQSGWPCPFTSSLPQKPQVGKFLVSTCLSGDIHLALTVGACSKVLNGPKPVHVLPSKG